MNLIISGDCGGTNTRLSLWSIESNKLKKETLLIVSKKYLNDNFKTFQDICELFLKENKSNVLPTVCVFACAGPILNNTVKFTNKDKGWYINGTELEKTLNIKKIVLINDFVACGYGLLTLKMKEVILLHQPEIKETIQNNNLNESDIILNTFSSQLKGPIATIGAGTGLGECYLTPFITTNNNINKIEYTCYPCEGGHTDYSPINELEIELLNYIKTKYNCNNRISVERIVSGTGLSNIYEFLCSKYPSKVNYDIFVLWENAKSQAGAVIGEYSKTDELCYLSMKIFIKAYGREAGNAILKYLPTGGFFITGGLAIKNLDFFTGNKIYVKNDIEINDNETKNKNKNDFLDSIFDKGRLSSTVKNIPIYLVLTEDLGERGASHYAYQLLMQENNNNNNNNPLEKTKEKSNIKHCLSKYYIGMTILCFGFGVLLGKKIRS